MKDGWIKVAAAQFPLSLGDPAKNAVSIIERIREADAAGVNLLVFPELCLTGASCGDLFFSDTLLRATQEALHTVAAATTDARVVAVIGLPLTHRGKLYDCAVVLSDGHLLGIVPKTHLSREQMRQFTPAPMMMATWGDGVPFGSELVFCHKELGNYAFAVEIGDEVAMRGAPSEALCAAGATIILNLAAAPKRIGSSERIETHLFDTSARLHCAYVRAGAGVGESTGDVVYAGERWIAQSGSIVACAAAFDETPLLVSEVDVARLSHDRRADGNWCADVQDVIRVLFDQSVIETPMTRTIRRTPFLPTGEGEMARRAEEILQLQAHGLARRLSHTYAKTAVIGISGGLDSTLALLVAVRAMDLLGRPRTDVLAVTMPCFGTTGRTKSNATKLCEELGVTLREIDIKASVLSHFADIGQSQDHFDVTYENAQARERTQVLMDLANMTSGLVIGTGDLSELALGWATYNGDHMSMYGVNADLPKTLIRHIVRYEASAAGGEIEKVLLDILDTPVSPELLPTDAQGNIAQKTEDLVGPYELHDFFLYHMLRYGASPRKIYRLARAAFAGEYADEVILKWLRVFHRRFFMQQFKRSCLPDGVAVGCVGLSPRGGWHMPTDAQWSAWQRELDAIEQGR